MHAGLGGPRTGPEALIVSGDEPIDDYARDPERLRRRMEWERDRARNSRRRRVQPDSGFESDFIQIVFPDAAGLRHAALVVAGAMADRKDAVEATRLLLDILGIPQIMREGGDGRPVKEQHGPVRFGTPGGPAFSVEIEDNRGGRHKYPKPSDPPEEPDAPVS